jgi:hypothetical protein
MPEPDAAEPDGTVGPGLTLVIGSRDFRYINYICIYSKINMQNSRCMRVFPRCFMGQTSLLMR